MKRVRRSFLLLFAAVAGTAFGERRNFPPGAKKGVLHPGGEEVRRVRIGSETLLLAPGAQIRDRSNRIVMPAMLSEPAPVRVQRDSAGRVFRIWILSEEEAALDDE